MRRIRLIAILVAAVGSFGLCRAADVDADVYQVGVAEVDITPAHPIRLNGFGGRRAESDGVNQKIFARAISIRHPNDREPLVLVTVDVLGITPSHRAELVKRLQGVVSSERFAITATHTHCGPMVSGANPTLFGVPIPDEHLKNIDRYTVVFLDKLEQVIRESLKEPQASRLYWGVGSVGFAKNRRTAGGPTDHDLPVLVVRDAKTEKVRAMYVTYACHCVTLSHNKIGGDWAGYAAEAIRDRFPGAVGLVSIGCGADQNPDSGVTGDKVETAQVQGRQIAEEVKRLINGFLAPVRGKPVCTFKSLSLPLAELPTRKGWEERAKRQDAIGHHAREQLAKLDRKEPLPTSIDYPIQTLAFGDSLALVHLPGEVVVDYATRLKKEFDRTRVWVTAYANTNPCYIPSERVLKEGGYEGGGAMVYYDVPVPFKPGLEDLIVREVKNQIGGRFSSPFDATKTNDEKPLSPQQSLQTLRTVGPFTVDLVAAEPLVADPVAMAFGPDGKLWVAEMLDYPNGNTEGSVPGGRIRFLEDRNGDGIADRGTTFVEGVPFPTGVLPWRKGVLITAAPDILYAEDTNADGRADVVTKLFSGFGTDNMQARVNGLAYGLDGWVYCSCGSFGGMITSHRTGKVISLGNRDFRFKPDTGELEAATGRTQQGRVRNDWGDWFGCDNSNLGRHYVLADHYLRRNPFVAPPNPEVYFPAGPDPNRLFPARASQLFALSGPAGRTTGACGIGVYRDSKLGDEFTGNTFTCEPVSLLVHRRVLKANGNTFRGDRATGETASEFLTSTDPWFRPVQAMTGPDGGLWIADMYRFVIEHPRWIPPSDLAKLDVRAGSGLGRIYRVRRTGEAQMAWPRLDALDGEGLVAALHSPNGWQRDMATEMLVWRSEKADIPSLIKLAKDAKRAETRLHALVTLDRLNALAPGAIKTALTDAHAGVRRHAVRMSEPYLNTDPDLATAVCRLVDDSVAPVRLQLAYSLGVWANAKAGEYLAKLVHTDGKDRYLLAAVVSSLNRDNFRTFVEHPEIASRASSHFLPQLIATAVGLGDDAVIASLLKLVTTSTNGEYQVWQYSALESLLEAQKRTPNRTDHWPAVESMLSAARAAALDSKVAPDLRVAATRLFGKETNRLTDDIAKLGSLLVPQTPATVQTAAVSTLGRMADDRAADVLLKGWTGYSPALQSQVIGVLLNRTAWIPKVFAALQDGRLPVSAIPAGSRQGLLTEPNVSIRKQAEAAFAGAVTANRQQLIDSYRTSLPKSGNALRGKEQFQKVCATCHQVQGVGHVVGPDLTALASKSADYLLTEILDPNRNLDNRYLQYTANTTDGRTLNGLLASESASAVTVRQADGRDVVLLRSDLESLKSSGRSLMPEGLEKDLSPAAMADVIAYLGSIGQPAKAIAGNVPKLVTITNDAYILRAVDCEIHGGDITFEPEFGNIGFWHGAKDHVAWQVRVATAGEFDVYFDYACDPGSTGGPFAFEGGEPTLRGRVASTGSWSNYRLLKVGTIKLNPGEIRLTLRPDAEALRGALIDLRTVQLVPKGLLPKGSDRPKLPATDDPAALAKFLLDDSQPVKDREAAVATISNNAAAVIRLMAEQIPNAKEEYRRIPWIWRVAIAAGKRNNKDELKMVLDVSLPKTGESLHDWQAVVIGGGVINGLSMTQGWPRPRVIELIGKDRALSQRWNEALAASAKMADDAKINTGTRYDALRMIALRDWTEAGQQLTKYLSKGTNAELQMGAVSGLVDIDSADATKSLVAALSHLTGTNRTLALKGLLRSDSRVIALLDAVEMGTVKPADLADIAESLRTWPTESIQTRARKLLKKPVQ
jgi:putative membrane-bound dehydrogenase-like protein